MAKTSALHCPIRGVLRVKARAADQLTFTEEKRRIDFIRRLIQVGYQKTFIAVETVVLHVGHGGRNTLRADVIVYDEPVAKAMARSAASRLSHARIIGEVKRDNLDAESAKEQQLKPALMFVPNDDAMGIYWDDLEQSLLVKDKDGKRTIVRELSIAHLPQPGREWRFRELSISDLEEVENLTGIFGKIDDILHQAGHDKEERYSFLLQLILLKIFDEQSNKTGHTPMIIQDFSDPSVSDAEVIVRLENGLKKSLALYQGHLPNKVSLKFSPSAATLRQISRWVCGLNLLGSSPEVMQEFYMYFARTIYKVDLAQHFTPYEVIDFIVKLANPKFGDSVKDPACGSADFLVAAFRVARDRHQANIVDQVYGADVGKSAVQISVLNMILNGDGKAHIVNEDSLVCAEAHSSRYSVMLCNPPFGTKILERRESVLKRFDLGRCALTNKGKAGSQETGILFTELCVRSNAPGGRTAIILPNGYLGNRSARYQQLRDWLLRHARPVAVVGFPRFTFKRSGADVSASVVVLERRPAPLEDVNQASDHPVYFNLVERIGWDVANKRAARIYKVEEETGKRLLDENNSPILDSGFDDVLLDIYSSPVVDEFQWLGAGMPYKTGSHEGAWVPASEIYNDPDLIMDPKRKCPKYRKLMDALEAKDHIRIGDVLQIVPCKTFRKKAENLYRYVEIGNVFENFGTYQWKEMRGWQLPGRAKLQAEPGDFFIANIWSSAGKWLRAGPDARDGRLIVTNGCIHARIKKLCEQSIPDLVFGFSSELFRVQMRALATGSDGLSAITEDDFLDIKLPKIPDDKIRELVTTKLSLASEGADQLWPIVSKSLSEHLPEVFVPPRWSHIVQV